MMSHQRGQHSQDHLCLVRIFLGTRTLADSLEEAGLPSRPRHSCYSKLEHFSFEKEKCWEKGRGKLLDRFLNHLYLVRRWLNLNVAISTLLQRLRFKVISKRAETAIFSLAKKTLTESNRIFDTFSRAICHFVPSFHLHREQTKFVCVTLVSSGNLGFTHLRSSKEL